MQKNKIKKAHEVAKKMLKGKSGEYMEKKYGSRAKEVAYATATKQQMSESKEYYKKLLREEFKKNEI